jgi:hypothetical protein
VTTFIEAAQLADSTRSKAQQETRRGEDVRAAPSRMTIDPTWLLVSLIPGGIGFVLFVYGK